MDDRKNKSLGIFQIELHLRKKVHQSFTFHFSDLLVIFSWFVKQTEFLWNDGNHTLWLLLSRTAACGSEKL